MRYNRPVPARGPVRTTGATTATYEGATGFLRDTKSELFLAAVSSFNEDLFYESADARLARMRPLVRQVALADPAWLIDLVGWLRRTANLRSIGIMIAAEGVKARLEAKVFGHNRELVGAAVLRADEAGEFLGYWSANIGDIRKVPSAVKRGLNDSLAGLREYDWLKWRGKGKRGAVSMRDVLNITHPKPVNATQSALFEAIMADAYGRGIDSTLLPMYSARTQWLGADLHEQRPMLRDPEFVRTAGITHEVAAGALGKLTAEDWEALLPSMGFQAVLMNLRRMHEAGIGDRARGLIRERLRNEERILSSRMLPMRFLSAYRNAPLEFAGDLEFAANVVLQNVPSLPGRSLILIDRSGSMQHLLSQRGTLTRVDAAAVFGSALALRAQDADLVAYGTRSQVVPFRKTDSLLRLADQRADMGGTNTHDAIAHHYRGHDRIILLTDEQASFNYEWSNRDVFAQVPDQVPCLTWNLSGYRAGHAPDSPNRWTFGGLSDAGMGMILPLERGITHNWPWEK
jgi:hypothetical protein